MILQRWIHFFLKRKVVYRVSSSIWIRVTNYISNDDNCYVNLLFSFLYTPLD